MAARCAHEAPRWVCLQPALTFTAVPDAVLRTKHPAPPLAVENGEVADREPKSSGLEAAVAALIDQQPVARLGVSKRIDSHPESIALWLGSPPRGELRPRRRRRR
jgi:hypothetical protein